MFNLFKIMINVNANDLIVIFKAAELYLHRAEYPLETTAYKIWKELAKTQWDEDATLTIEEAKK